jgi:trehalose 2-sulfotransferase
MPGSPPAPTLDQVFRELRAEADAAPASSERQLSSKTLLIAMLPRTGSTALCSLLEATGVLGFPREYLNPRGPLKPWARRLSASNLSEYLEALRREQVTPNGVFGFKTLYPDLEPLLDRAPIAELLDAAQFVYLTREDRVAQAISEYLADRSGVWHQDAEGERFRSRGGGDPDPPYNEAEILRRRDALAETEADWERFFGERSIEPLRITYERFVADANATVRAIARHVGVEWEGELSLEGAETTRLADARSERWAQRFREARGR